MGRRVTANFFDVLGVQPLLGRTFTEEEDRSRRARHNHQLRAVAAALQRRRSVVGKPIVMNGERRTIIGVMPKAFVFRDRDREFWIPIVFSPEQQGSAHRIS